MNTSDACKQYVEFDTSKNKTESMTTLNLTRNIIRTKAIHMASPSNGLKALAPLTKQKYNNM